MPLPMESRGYPLPEIVDPGELVCVQLWIPNDIFYIRALSGHLELLARWKAWEKDGTARASQASSVWKDALDYTHENGWIGACGMSEECCQAIVEAINNISITVNCSGGGSDMDIPKRWVLPDGWEDGRPESLPTLPEEPTTTPNGDLCDQAHQTWSKLREFIGNFNELTNEESPYEELLAYMIGLGIFIVPPASVLFSLLTLGSGALYGWLERDTIRFWEEMKDDFVCGVLSNNNPSGFYSWLVEYINLYAPNSQVALWLKTILQMPDWEKLYDNEFDLEPEFVGSDCSHCTSNPIENVVWKPGFLNETLMDDKTGLKTIAADWYDFNADILSGQTWATDIYIEPPLLQPNEQIVATTWFVEVRTLGGTLVNPITVAGEGSMLPHRILSYAVGYEDLINSQQYDATYAHPIGNVGNPFTIENRCSAGVESGSLYVRVSEILWAVETIV